ncbi:hypothetical protein MTO96_037085 [Rhipicephalus appendiculatus]
MSRVFEIVQLRSDLRADAASDRGAVLALKDQLVESRRETAALHRRALLAETRSCLLPPVAVAGGAATAAPDPTQPGTASTLPGLFFPGTASQPAPRTYATALLSGAAPTAPSVRPGLDDPIPALPTTLHEHVAFVTPLAPKVIDKLVASRNELRKIDAEIEDVIPVEELETEYESAAHYDDQTLETLTRLRCRLEDLGIAGCPLAALPKFLEYQILSSYPSTQPRTDIVHVVRLKSYRTPDPTDVCV